jgi:hypothetical protein
MTRVRRVSLAAVDLSSPRGVQALAEELAPALATVRSAGGSPTQVVVAVGLPPVQKRRLYRLPGVSPKVLRDMIGHQASKFFRPASSGLVIDAAWTRRRGASSEAVAIAVECDIVAAIMEACSNGGIELIDIVPDVPDLPLRLSLLPEEERKSRRRLAWSKTYGIAKLTVVLWCVMLGIGVVSERIDHSATTARLDALRKPASRVLEVRHVMDSVRAMLDTIANGKERRLAVAGMLSNLAIALPDSSILSGVVLSLEGTGEITGLGVDPMGVLAGLQAKNTGKVELVNDPTAESAGRPGWSRFVMRLGTVVAP